MAHSRSFSVLGGLSLALALFGAAGCTHPTGSEQGAADQPGSVAAPVTEAAKPADQVRPADQAKAPDAPCDDKADEGPGHHRGKGMRGHHGGPEGLLFAAKHELELSEAQKTAIDGAISGLKGEGPHARPEGSNPLAEAVRAGKIDEAQIASRTAEHEKRMAEHQAKMAQALTTLHDTLTPEQRKQLVEKVAARMDEHGPRGDKADKGEHERKGPPGMKGEPGTMGPMGHLLRGVELRDDQKAAVEKALAAQAPAKADHDAMRQQFEAMRKNARARLDSFTADRFDAKAFVAPPEGAGFGPKAHGARLAKALSAIVPLLDAQQREQLAKNLEQGPRPGMHGPAAREP